MTRFLLIRHARKSTPDALIVGRSPGIHLHEEGRKQADALAHGLASVPIAHVVSSPLERAIETAEPLAESHGLRVETSAAFLETDFGEWTMKTLDELRTLDAWRRYNTFRSCTRAPGGETMLEMQQRFISGLLGLQARFPDSTVAVVSHGDPIRAAVCYFAGTPLDLWHRFEISVGSISVVDLGSDHAVIQGLNRSAPAG